MTTEDGGWLRMRLNNLNQVVAAEYHRSNPFYKCADDEARMYDWINQTDISPDSSPNNSHIMRLPCRMLATDQTFTDAQMSALRNQIDRWRARPTSQPP